MWFVPIRLVVSTRVTIHTPCWTIYISVCVFVELASASEQSTRSPTSRRRRTSVRSVSSSPCVCWQCCVGVEWWWRGTRGRHHRRRWSTAVSCQVRSSSWRRIVAPSLICVDCSELRKDEGSDLDKPEFSFLVRIVFDYVDVIVNVYCVGWSRHVANAQTTRFVVWQM